MSNPRHIHQPLSTGIRTAQSEHTSNWQRQRQVGHHGSGLLNRSRCPTVADVSNESCGLLSTPHVTVQSDCATSAWPDRGRRRSKRIIETGENANRPSIGSVAKAWSRVLKPPAGCDRPFRRQRRINSPPWRPTHPGVRNPPQASKLHEGLESPGHDRDAGQARIGNRNTTARNGAIAAREVLRKGTGVIEMTLHAFMKGIEALGNRGESSGSRASPCDGQVGTGRNGNRLCDATSPRQRGQASELNVGPQLKRMASKMRRHG